VDKPDATRPIEPAKPPRCVHRLLASISGVMVVVTYSARLCPGEMKAVRLACRAATMLGPRPS
jgi:hypothetical protein